MNTETKPVRFLYNTRLGRCFLKVLSQPWFSKLAATYLNSPLSRPIVPLYAKRNHIDLQEFSKQKYRSFNDFFTRRRIDDTADTTPGHLISPCDAFLSVYPIREDSVYTVKHVQYRLEQLLDDAELAKRYAGGTCLIFRLSPKHYHRYCYPCNGVAELHKSIKGKLHCVRPIAYTSMPVFAQNSREYTVIQSSLFGEVTQMEVGALLVGKIKNYPAGRFVRQGSEKGYFEFGGSTVILLLEKGRVRIDPVFLAGLGKEIDVRKGSKIGELTEKKHSRTRAAIR